MNIFNVLHFSKMFACISQAVLVYFKIISKLWGKKVRDIENERKNKEKNGREKKKKDK